jgi:hypothetical protein
MEEDEDDGVRACLWGMEEEEEEEEVDDGGDKGRLGWWMMMMMMMMFGRVCVCGGGRGLNYLGSVEGMICFFLCRAMLVFFLFSVKMCA